MAQEAKRRNLEENRKERALGKFLGRMQNRRALQAFAGWHAVATERVVNRVRVARSLGRLQRSTLARSFATLAEKAARRRTARSTVVSIVLAHVRKRVARAFYKYKDQILLQRAGDLATKKKAALLGRMMARVAHRQASRAFAGWVAAASGRRENRVRVARSLGRLANRCKAKVFNTWQGSTRDIISAKTKIVALLQRRYRKTMLEAFIQYKDRIVIKRAEDAREGKKLAQLRGFRTRMRLRVEAGAFRGG